MSNETNIKHGFRIDGGQAITGVTNNPASNDQSVLLTSASVYQSLTAKTDVLAFNAFTATTSSGLSDFNSHSADTTIHFHLSAITLSNIGNSAHTHTVSQISDISTNYAGLTPFNSHTGNTTIHFTKNSINLSDLGNSAHTHSIGNIINLQNELDGKTNLSSFTGHTGDTTIHFTKNSINLSDLGNSAHTHNISDVNNLQNELNNKANTSGSTFGWLSANTITANTITLTDYIDYNAKSGLTAKSGRTYFDVGENALSYFPSTPNMDVTINIGQESVIPVYNNTGSIIHNGTAVYINGSFNNTPTVELAIASAITVITDTSYQVTGIATHDIAHGSVGFVTVFGKVRNLPITGTTAGSNVYLSDIVKGGLMFTQPSNNSSRESKIGRVLQTGATDGIILVDLQNEPALSLLSARQIDVLTVNNSSTGIVNGGLMSTGSTTGFTITSGKGYIADNSNPLTPSFKVVEFSGCTNKLCDYVNDPNEFQTCITIDLNGNIIQTRGSVGLTPAQKRTQILIGCLIHTSGVLLLATKRQIMLTNPINQLEDLTTSIGPFAISGNRISKITGALSLVKSTGEAFYFGGNTNYQQTNPNMITTNILSGSTLLYANGGRLIGLSGNSIQTSLYDPTRGVGGLSAITNNYFVAHRIWHQPTENKLIYQYPQYEYKTLADARVGFASEEYLTPNLLVKECYLVAVILTQEGVANLDDTTLSQIIPQGKFAGTGGGGTTPDTLQTAYENSVTPEIITANGAVDFKEGQASNASPVINVWDNTNVINFTITGEGKVTGNTLTANFLYGNGSGLTNISLAHNTTTNIQGGTSGQYFHLDQSEYSKVSGNTLANTYTNLTNFSTHTGDTTVHFTKSSINLSDLGNSAHTHSISEVNNLQVGLNSKADLSGATFAGNVTASTFFGNGSGLTSVNDTTALKIANNLSDVNNASTSLLNIGGQGYHGFVNRTDSNLPSTITSITGFTITPNASYVIYINANKYTINSSKSVNITNTVGTWYIYFYISGGTPVLGSSQNPWNILDLTAIPVATVYWTGTVGLVDDERHAYNRNLQYHLQAHTNWGAQYVSGFVGATFTGAGAAQSMSVPGGVINDEDIYATIAGTQTQCRIGYRTAGATAMTFDAISGNWTLLTGSVPNYDNNGVITPVTNNLYAASYLYATTRTETNAKLVSIIGQGQFTTVALTQAAPLPSLPAMSVAEWKLIYRIIYRRVGGGGGVFQYVQADPLYLTNTGLVVNAGSPSTISEGNVTTTPRTILSGTTQSVNNDIIESQLSYLNTYKTTKASAYTTNNIMVFDANGNDKDSGLSSDYVDVYSLNETQKTFLSTESNWLSGTTVLAQITTDFGFQGNRYTTTLWAYECYEDLKWVRYPAGVSYIDIYAVPDSEKTKVDTSGNWSGTIYTGSTLTGCSKGMRYVSSTHVYEFYQDNTPCRTARV